jgi:hypothetical protein
MMSKAGRRAAGDVADSDCERHCPAKLCGVQHVEASLASLLTRTEPDDSGVNVERCITLETVMATSLSVRDT